MKKILAIDVGNSNIVIGLFEGERLRWHRRFETGRTLRKAHLLRCQARRLLDVQPQVRLRRASPACLVSGTFFNVLRKLCSYQVDGVVVASVVPKIDKPLRLLLRKKFGVKPLFVTSKIKLPIKIKTKRPSEVGADRLANAVSAYCLYEKIPPTPLCKRGARGDFKAVPIIIIDFGTATTFDVVSGKGKYLGGPIVPGLKICLEALHEKTAKLPLVSIAKPGRVIGNETRESIQGGLYYGYAGLVDRLVLLIQKELGKKARVIATGGFAALIAKECRTIQTVEPFLTLKGLRRLSLESIHCGENVEFMIRRAKGC